MQCSSKEIQTYNHLAFTWLDLPLTFCQVEVVEKWDGDDGEGKKGAVGSGGGVCI